MTTPEVIRTTLLDLLKQRGSGKTICPSEVARQLGDSTWREMMVDLLHLPPTLNRLNQDLPAG